MSADVKAELTDLSWMTGDWSGPLGGGAVLEEHWLEPRGGSLTAIVRLASDEATPMVELIVIEKEGDSLVLRLQQWNPGFSPRSEAPQTMRLLSLEPNKVWFEATEEGGLKKLGYSRDGDKFSVHGVQPDGTEFTLPLAAMK